MGDKQLVVAEFSNRDRRLMQRLVRAVERIAHTENPLAGPGEADLGMEFDELVSDGGTTPAASGQIRHGGKR